MGKKGYLVLIRIWDCPSYILKPLSLKIQVSAPPAENLKSNQLLCFS